MKVKTIFGIDTNGNDIFVIQKANMFKIITEKPTSKQWSDIAVEFNMSIENRKKVEEDFREWKNWYLKATK